MKQIEKKGWPESVVAKMMVSPALIVIGMLAVYPLFYTVYISFFDINLINNTQTLIGIKNYIDVFTSKDFVNSLWITLKFTFFSLAVQMPLGILTALLLNQEFHGRWLLRTVVLMPWAVPTLVNASLWNWIYNVQYGALNRLLIQFHIIHEPVVWLAEPNLAMAMIILADTWRMMPLYTLMFLASLQTISKTYTEAAVLDGANVFRRLFHIIIPLIMPMIMVVLVIRTMQALKVFDIIYMLTRGGPINSTMVLNYYIYNQTFGAFRFSYGSALAIVVAIISILITIAYIRVLRTEDIY